MEIKEITRHFPGYGQQLAAVADDKLQLEILQLSITERLRETMKSLRGALGYSAKRFGSMCGVTQQYIFSLESGRANWNLRLICNFNEALKNTFACPTDSESAEQAGG